MSNQQEFRRSVLASYGASASQTEELLAYNQNLFSHKCLKHAVKFPLAPEAHVSVWEDYVFAARVIGAFEALKQRLVQFRFPILKGISQTEAYRSATRKGVPVDNISEATGLILTLPEKLQLIIHQSLAGAIPVLLAGNREDFVTLVQALTMQNEPKLVPTSMGACMVAGFNNWDRIGRDRQQWSARNSGNCSENSWAAEFQRIIPQKALYHDRFIILSDGFYSNVSAKDMGLEELEWQRLQRFPML
jgi:hypothetical protein